MAKAKKSTPKTTKLKTKPAAHTAAELEVLDSSQADALLARLLAQHPSITPGHRTAFASLLTDAQADDFGKRTRGADVRAEALRWAVQIDSSLRAYPGALSGYGAARFVYFLECARGLHDALGADDKKRQKLDLARGAADSVRGSAAATRSKIASVLRTFAGRRVGERNDLAAALGTSDTPDKIGLSLTALAKLGNTWLDRTDADSKILAETAGLTAGTITAAVNAAKSLQTAAAGASMEGRARPTDTPPVNRAEGRLLFEMIEARRIFNEANAQTGVVPKLSPGASVRHVFVRKTSAAGVEEDIADDEPPAGDAPAPPKG